MTVQSKILVYLPNRNLPNHNLNKIIIECSTLERFSEKLTEYRASNPSIVCTEDGLRIIAPSLSGIYLQKLYILRENAGHTSINPLIEDNWNSVIVFNENQLMRQISTNKMIDYYKHGCQHRKNGDCGLANLCFADARDALDLAATFI